MSATATPGNTLGRFLKARREELNLSRESFVKRTGNSLTTSHCFRVERGLHMPSADTLDRIADGLGLDRNERAYVHLLIAEKPRPTFTPRETVPEAVRRVVQFQQPASAYVVTTGWTSWTGTTLPAKSTDQTSPPLRTSKSATSPGWCSAARSCGNACATGRPTPRQSLHSVATCGQGAKKTAKFKTFFSGC